MGAAVAAAALALWPVVLQVRVDDQDPFPAGDPRTGPDRAAQAAAPLVRLTVHQADRYATFGTQFPYDVRGLVVAVVHHQDLRVNRFERLCQPSEQHTDVVCFVAGRNQHRQLSRALVGAPDVMDGKAGPGCVGGFLRRPPRSESSLPRNAE